MDLNRHTLIDPGLFAAQDDAAAQRRLFARYVQNVTLELFDYCNRQCSYCPVSLIDRRSKIQRMTKERFHWILDDLVEIGYARSICLNLFNEPLADEFTYEAVAQFKEKLPDARVWFNTNGDYLNRRVLERLSSHGVSRLVVTPHVARDATYDDGQQIGRISQLSARTGVAFAVERFRPQTDIRASGRFRGMEITVKSVNYDDFGVNRGGSLDHIPLQQERFSPCDRPFHEITIAWNGNVYPCCQFIEGLAEHDRFVVGTISRPGAMFALYCSAMMSGFRRESFGYGPKLAPCDSCADRDRCRGDEDRKKRATWADRNLRHVASGEA